ncbi:MAG: nitroreductase family protein [Crocinitomicaceae bacterium]|nr:nitroreductase family protein [Crocinitomicaceae bacterium]|tara:strand:+ start:5406 stop:6068 length:663 start_codon:yes stop_codon:yes gene_type:complete
MENGGFVPFQFEEKTEDQMLASSKAFYEEMNRRRSVREFSDKPVSIEVIKNIIRSAGTAPSGAHKQPWSFCVVQDASIKSKIRAAAEQEEYENYHGRMSEEWLKDLEKFDTNHIKPFLEIAPYLIVVFKQAYNEDGSTRGRNYYVNESVGIAVGMLLAAIQNAGLVALTHTPSPMNFLAEILERPKNERAYLLIPVGYPVDECMVPDIERKKIEEICKVY